MSHSILGSRRRAVALRVAVVTVAVSAVMAANAAVTARYNFELPDTLTNSAGEASYQPNMTNPPSPSSPTFLPNGGAFNSGAYQFDGTSNFFGFRNAGYLFVANSFSNWTVSFWIKTTDNGTNTGGYAGTPKVPVLGNVTGGVGFGIGIDGGMATYKRHSGSWQTAQGATNVADGLGHYVTFVAVGSSNLNIYVDGQLDTANLSIPASGFSQLGESIGRSYLAGGSTATYNAVKISTCYGECE